MPSKTKAPNLDGMKPERIEAIEEKAEELKTVRQERMDLTQREVKAQDDLLEVMRKNKVREYRIGNTLFVVADGKTKVKVKQVSDNDDDSDTGAGEKGKDE